MAASRLVDLDAGSLTRWGRPTRNLEIALHSQPAFGDKVGMETNNNTVRVTFRKQGGKSSDGTAVGRKGKQLLIAYSITNGEPRRRWITPDRYTVLDGGDISTLPLYRAAYCPAVTFDAPIIPPAPDAPASEWQAWQSSHGGHYSMCPTCGRLHRQTAGATVYERTRGFKAGYHAITGRARRKLGDVLVED
jgi:hypothetical protein